MKKLFIVFLIALSCTFLFAKEEIFNYVSPQISVSYSGTWDSEEGFKSKDFSAFANILYFKCFNDSSDYSYIGAQLEYKHLFGPNAEIIEPQFLIRKGVEQINFEFEEKIGYEFNLGNKDANGFNSYTFSKLTLSEGALTSCIFENFSMFVPKSLDSISLETFQVKGLISLNFLERFNFDFDIAYKYSKDKDLAKDGIFLSGYFSYNFQKEHNPASYGVQKNFHELNFGAGFVADLHKINNRIIKNAGVSICALGINSNKFGNGDRTVVDYGFSSDSYRNFVLSYNIIKGTDKADLEIKVNNLGPTWYFLQESY